MIDLNTQFRDFPDMLTPPDITKMLNISKTSTYRLLSENIIPSIRLGRVYRIPKAYVLQYISEHVSVPATTPSAEATVPPEIANPTVSINALTVPIGGATQ